MSLLIAFLILLGSFPVGYLVRGLTKEEIEPGRKYFRGIWIVCLVLSVLMLFYSMRDLLYQQAIVFTLLFIANVAFISWKNEKN
tara:strand:- start:2795 stop:3046 length:252 start_codon:yes stop_codon:yes gene_type:complete